MAVVMERDADKAVAKLAMSEEHLRSILATVPDAMIIIDENGTMLSFSVAAEKMFGYTEAEVIGENVSMLMPSPDREQHDSYLSEYRKTGVRKIIGIGRVTIARRRDGSTFPIELSVGEASVDGTRVFTGFIHDISQTREFDLRLRDLQAELAHAGRFTELGSLASSLAHELNQPLTAIANYCEGANHLLEQNDDKLRKARELLQGVRPHATVGDDDAEPATAAASRCETARNMLEINEEYLAMAREALQDAADQALRAGQIVKRMRDFLSHGDGEHQPETLTRLVTEANALALVGTREHGIDVQVHLDPRCNHVFVDRIQIQQVLFNLIRNAVEAMIDSPVRSLTISSTAGPPGFATVTVEDTGKGVSEEVAAQLFRPFVTSKKGGMGIGLSICRTIIEAHGGRIWMEQGRGGGTIFRFTIPQMEADDEQP